MGFDAVDTESYNSWHNFLQNLRSRGLTGVACVVSDAHEGLKRAIAETFYGAAWQRCIVHLERNICKLINNKRQCAMAAKAMQAVFREEEPAALRAAYHAAIDAIEKMNPKTAELLEEDVTEKRMLNAQLVSNMRPTKEDDEHAARLISFAIEEALRKAA